MAIATPIAMVVGIGVGARNGVLFKSAGALESTAALTHICLDKTGTLTEGRASVVDSLFLGAHAEEDKAALWRVVAAVEGNSQHPLAEVLAKHARAQTALETAEAEGAEEKRLEVEEVELVEGMGLACRVEGRRTVVGSMELLQKHGAQFQTEAVSVAEAWERAGRTVVWVGTEGKEVTEGGERRMECGLGIAVEDPVLAEASAVVSELYKARPLSDLHRLAAEHAMAFRDAMRALCCGV